VRACCRLLLPLLLPQALEHAPRLALRELAEVVVVRRDLHEPLALDVGHGADPVLRGQHKLVVEHPLRLVIQTRRRVQLRATPQQKSVTDSRLAQLLTLRGHIKEPIVPGPSGYP